MNKTFYRMIGQGWTNMASTLGPLLRQEMKQRKMEQGPFAEFLDVAPSQLSEMLNNPDLIPKLKTLDQLAEKLGRDLGDLIVAVGFTLDQNRSRGKSEQVTMLLEDVPEMRGFVDDLMRLRPEDLRRARAFVQGVRQQAGVPEENAAS
jgi:transcriptional regulator with XRE-family HTH domain